MKKFINKADDFLKESLNGFGKAHSDIIQVSLDPSFVSRKNKTKEGKVSLIYKTHTVASGLVETYGKNLIEAVKKRDQIAFESLKYMNEKTKNLSF